MDDALTPPEPLTEPDLSSGTKARKKTQGSIWPITRRILGILTIIPTAIIALWIIFSVTILTSQAGAIDLDTITVPESLDKKGYTSDIATKRLRDAISVLQNSSNSTMAKTRLEIDQELSAITIPKTGLSLQGIAATIRGVIPAWRREISGEFTESGTTLSLRIRLNSEVIYSGTALTVDSRAADTLIGEGLHGAAFEIVRRVQPYVAISAIYGDGTSLERVAAADNAANDLIALLPAYDENVKRAENLKGLIALARDDDDAAVQYFKIADIVASHANLVLLYCRANSKFYNLDDALSEAYIVLIRDPGFFSAYRFMGDVYSLKKEYESSIPYYKMGIQLGEKQVSGSWNRGMLGDGVSDTTEGGKVTFARHELAYAEGNLGYAYLQAARGDPAAEYQKAINLDPAYAWPHAALADLRVKQHRFEDAIAEYEFAIQLEPAWRDPYVALAEVLDIRPAQGSAY